MKKIIIKETIVPDSIEADYMVHPIAAPIFIFNPEIVSELYKGCVIDLYISKNRDLTPLVIGVIAMNIMTAKTKGVPYPDQLIEKNLWTSKYLVRYAKRYLFTETGYEASLRTLNPLRFIYLRHESSVHNLKSNSLITIKLIDSRTDDDLGCVINSKIDINSK